MLYNMCILHYVKLKLMITSIGNMLPTLPFPPNKSLGNEIRVPIHRVIEPHQVLKVRPQWGTPI